jgi:hypothetical protein
MRVGVLVDGDAESQALRNLTRRIAIPGVQVADPIYAPMQPNATPERIVADAKERLEALVAVRRVNKVLVLIDRESRTECPGIWATTLGASFHAAGYPLVSVVVKNRKLENWLISDTSVFRRARGRYKLTNSFINSVERNKADNVEDAETLLNSIVIGSSYHKRKDAAQITALQDPITMALHSRSFRRLLRLLGDSSYESQSRRPAT